MAKFVEQGMVGLLTASGIVTLTAPDLLHNFTPRLPCTWRVDQMDDGCIQTLEGHMKVYVSLQSDGG